MVTLKFVYVAYTQSGEKVTGTLDAESEAVAEQSLWQSQYTVVSLRKSFRLPNRYEAIPSVFKVRPKDIVGFSRQTATLLASGLSINAAVRILVERGGGNPLLRATLNLALNDLEAGSSFSEACAKHPKVFPSIFVRLIHVGEATGQLEPMLLRAATYLEKQGALAGRIRKALTYPAFVGAAGLVAIYILLTYSVPALSNLFKEYRADLPATTKAVMFMADAAKAYGRQAGLVILGLSVLAWWYTTTASGRRRRDRFLLTMPGIRSVVGGEAISRLGYTLSTLLASGLGFSETMSLASQTTDNRAMRDALDEVRADVLTGQKLSHAMSRHDVFPHMVSQMVSVGEETGKLEQNLHLVGDFYEKETEQAVATLTAIMEPAAIVGVGGFVGFIAMVMMNTIYGIIRRIGP